MKQIGPYHIVRLLGKGGMGVVYEANHQTTGRRCAIKVLLPERAHDRDAVQRFFTEARAVTQIEHPSLVQVSDFGQSADGTAYLVMEYLAGETLTAQLNALRGIGQRMPLGSTLRIASQMADVLAAAHEQGIVHRDLKPDNIMLVPDGKAPDGQRVKLLDFGIAKLVQSSGKTTNTHTLLGTPRYMSPEQCRGAGKVDQKTDVYALGIILYEILAGRLPFVGEGEGDFIAQHIVAEPPALTAFAPQVPAELAALVHRLLVKDKTQRPEMVEVRALVGQQLERVHEEESTQFLRGLALDQATRQVALPLAPSTLGASSAQAMGAPPQGSPRRTRQLVALGGGGLLVGLVVYAAAVRVGDNRSTKAKVVTRVAVRVSARAAAPGKGVADSAAAGSEAGEAVAPITKPGAVSSGVAATPEAPGKRAIQGALPEKSGITLTPVPSGTAQRAAAATKRDLETALVEANNQYQTGQYDRATKSAYAIFHDYPQATKPASKPGQRAWLIIGLSSCRAKSLAAVNAAYQHLDPAKKQALAYGCQHYGIFLSNGKFSGEP